MLRRIRSVTVEPNYALRLTYEDGGTVVVDMAPRIARGGVFAALRDCPLFAQVGIGERGRYIHWPGDIDLCADALWLEGQVAPEAAHAALGE